MGDTNHPLTPSLACEPYPNSKPVCITHTIHTHYEHASNNEHTKIQHTHIVANTTTTTTATTNATATTTAIATTTIIATSKQASPPLSPLLRIQDQ